MSNIWEDFLDNPESITGNIPKSHRNNVCQFSTTKLYHRALDMIVLGVVHFESACNELNGDFDQDLQGIINIVLTDKKIPVRTDVSLNVEKKYEKAKQEIQEGIDLLKIMPNWKDLAREILISIIRK